MHLARGSGAIALGFLLFALRLCGGGDVKLFAAVSLWAGPSLFIPFAYYTALAGGLMALVLWLNHKVKRAGIPANLLFVRSDAAFAKQPMPYGVAIAAGGLFVALQLLLKVCTHVSQTHHPDRSGAAEHRRTHAPHKHGT